MPRWDTVATVVTTAAWGLVACTWVVGALYNARHAPPADKRSRTPAAWLPAAVGVWLLFRLVGDGTWHAITLKPDWPRAFGLPLFVAATGFTLWARRALGTMWSSAVLIKTGHELRTGGPYAVTRHPIYTGFAGMLAGATLVNGGGRWVVILAAGMAFMAGKIRAEERLLSERFPARYEDYRNSVPQLMPRVARPR